MYENLKKIIKFLNTFCDKQQNKFGCSQCPNNNECCGNVWEYADSELREVTKGYSGEEINIS